MNTNKEAPQTLAHKKVKQHKCQHKHRTHTTQTRRSKQHRERKAPHSSECTDTTHQNNINKTRLTSSVQRRNVCDVSLQSQQNRKLDNLTQVLKLVLVVIAAFFICWSPQQLLMAHAIFSTDRQLTR